MLSKVAGKAFSYAQSKISEARRRAYKSLPVVFGHPIRGSLVQLYRNDGEYETQVSLVNYLSFYGANRSTRIRYALTAYNSAGNRIASTEHIVGPEQTILSNLEQLLGKRLDEFGIFTVDVSYEPRYSADLGFLGETSPQFMTFFIPRDGRSAPQMIHSHKRLQKLPTLRQKIARVSAFSEKLEDLEELGIYLLNSSPSPLNARIELRDDETREVWKTFDVAVRGHGTARVVVEDLSNAPGKTSMCYEVDRRIDHRKPILFRKTKSGFLSCNHS